MIGLGPIVLPLQGLKITQIVAAAAGDGENVVYLPPRSVLFKNAVLVPVYPGTAGILAPYCGINAKNNGSFTPDGFDDVGAELATGHGFTEITYCHDDSNAHKPHKHKVC